MWLVALFKVATKETIGKASMCTLGAQRIVSGWVTPVARLRAEDSSAEADKLRLGLVGH